MTYFLIVGLGNPGQRYQLNRHNVGFTIVDALSEAHNFPDFNEKFNALVSQKDIDEIGRVILLKPQTFMNLSGKSVAAVCQFYKIPMDQVYVIHDDIDLQPGQIRMKKGGGHGGHNGLKSIDACSGQQYWRVRIGVGRPINPFEDVSSYVLGNFTKEDLDGWLLPTLQAFIKQFTALFKTSQDVWLKDLVQAQQSFLAEKKP